MCLVYEGNVRLLQKIGKYNCLIKLNEYDIAKEVALLSYKIYKQTKYN